MWYKIWTFFAEAIPVIVLSLLISVVVIVFVLGTHTCEPPKAKCSDGCSGHPYYFTITVEE